MTKTFNTAEEARAVIYELGGQLFQLPWNHDLNKMHNNLSAMVTELSQLEVYTRRTHPHSRYHTAYKMKKTELETGINYLNNLLLMHRLMS